MDKKIKMSLRVVNREIETNAGSYNFAIIELKNRLEQLKPLFNECCEKGISIQEISPELNEEWNSIYLALSNKRKEYENKVLLPNMRIRIK